MAADCLHLSGVHSYSVLKLRFVHISGILETGIPASDSSERKMSPEKNLQQKNSTPT